LECESKTTLWVTIILQIFTFYIYHAIIDKDGRSIFDDYKRGLEQAHDNWMSSSVTGMV